MNYFIRFNTGQYMGFHGKPANMTSNGMEKRFAYANRKNAQRALKRYTRLYPDWVEGATVERAAW